MKDPNTGLIHRKEAKEEANQKPPAMKLNLGGVKNTSTGAPVQSMGLGLNLGAIQKNEEAEEEVKIDRTHPAM